MIVLIGLWILSFICGVLAIVVREGYSPGKIAFNVLLTLFMVLTLGLHLATICFTAFRSAFFSMIAIMIFDFFWFSFAPYYPNSDPAGNGMAMGFRSFFIFAAGIILGVISLLLILFVRSGETRIGLYFVLFVAAWIGVFNIFANQSSYLSGDSLDSSARWARLKVEDYRKALIRRSMVEKNDTWDAKELDAVPKELEHWDIYGCKSISIRTPLWFQCSLLEGKFEFLDETREAPRSGLPCGCLGYTGSGDANDRTTFMPEAMTLAWYDTFAEKSYKIQTTLPKELNHYFDDTDRFWLDDIEFRILPWGRVRMYHNRYNQIHNIMIDHPLMGEETDEYSVETEALPSDNASRAPSPETIDDHLRRFPYSISFRSEGGRFTITKTICNFFNGEKILSDGEWKEEMDPARIKDVFLRFEDERARYAAFVYFEKDEVKRIFDEAFANDAPQGEFVITCGDKLSAFSFALRAGDKSYPLEKTEIRLYRVSATERGKRVFKNYKGNHKNFLFDLPSRWPL